MTIPEKADATMQPQQQLPKTKNTQQPETKNVSFKAGFIAITGYPNSGKSTLLNTIIGEKIAIVSPKPQTTQIAIKGIYTYADSQIIFIDTPGIHKTKHQFGKFMIKEINSALNNIDAVLLLVDTQQLLKKNEFEKLIGKPFDFISKSPTAKILALNKMDLFDRQLLLPLIDKIQQFYQFNEIIPISAKSGFNVDELLKTLKKYLPDHPAYYDDDIITDLQDTVFIAEIVREKVIETTYQEIPHSVACKTLDFQRRKNGNIYIRCCIYVERAQQKGIIIGAKATMLKKIGSAARKELEDYFKTKIFLELEVKTLENWRYDDKKIIELKKND